MSEQFVAALKNRVADNQYISHIKVREHADNASGAPAQKSAYKTRYIILGQSPSQQRAYVYKARRNANGTLSIGKEWDATQVRSMCREGSMLLVTFSITHRWEVDASQDPVPFLNHLASIVIRAQGTLPKMSGWSYAEPGTSQGPDVSGSAMGLTGSQSQSMSQHASQIASPVAQSADTSESRSMRSPQPIQAASIGPAVSTTLASPKPGMTKPGDVGPLTQGKQTTSSSASEEASLRESLAASTIPQQVPARPAVSQPRMPQRAPQRTAQPTLASTALSSSATSVSGSSAAPAPTKPLTGAPQRPALQRRLTRPTAAQASTALVAPRGDENSTLSQVEEMLEGFEWKVVRHSADIRQKNFGTADVIEERLLEELAALESSGIHAMIEPDQRVAQLLQHIDDSLLQLDRLDASVAGYKMQLLSRSEDIAYIQNQNKGLQVQTSNRHLLLNEVDTLLSTIQVDQQAMQKLASTSLSSGADASELESAAVSLYKSILQARPDRHKHTSGTETEAMAQHLANSEAVAKEFNTRLVSEFESELEKAMHAQLNHLPHTQQAMSAESTLPPHDIMEQWLGKYCGLSLYLRETTPHVFQDFSRVYMACESQCFRTELQRVFGVATQQVARSEGIARQGSLRRGGASAGTGPPAAGSASDGMPGATLQRILASLLPRVTEEHAFLADLLQINDDTLTFADYMDLEPYFKHRAAVTMALATESPQQAMDRALQQIFSVMVPELDSFVSHVAQQNIWSVVGMLVETELAQRALQQRPGGAAVSQLLNKNTTRLHTELSRLIHTQLQAVEQTKVTAKKREGILPIFQSFPTFVRRMEAQLGEADTLPVREAVDHGYERIARGMMAAVQSIPQAGAIDDDKGQLNHHVILIVNVYHLCTRVRPGTPPNQALLRVQQQAQTLLESSQHGYVKTMLRRPLGKVVDFGNGIDALLSTTPATEVALHSSYSRAAVKKLVRDFTMKDVRKCVEALSKRMQKHFDDDDASMTTSGALARDELADVLAQVWHATEDAFVAEVERLGRILHACYPQSGLHLDVSAQDVVRLFQTQAPTIRRR